MGQYVVGNASGIVDHTHGNAAVFGSDFRFDLMRTCLRGIYDKVIEHDKEVVVSFNQNIPLQVDVQTRGSNRFTRTGFQYPADL